MLEAQAKKEDNRQAHRKRKTREDDASNHSKSERKKALLALQSWTCFMLGSGDILWRFELTGCLAKKWSSAIICARILDSAREVK